MKLKTVLAQAAVVGAAALSTCHAWAEPMTFRADEFAAIVEGVGNPFVTPGVVATLEATFQISEASLQSLHGFNLTAITPATLDEANGVIAWTTPMDTLTVSQSWGLAKLQAVTLSGGLTLSVEAGALSNAGGSVTIRNLKLVTGSYTEIYADVQGANGHDGSQRVALFGVNSGGSSPTINMAPYWWLNDCPGGCMNNMTFLSHTYGGLYMTDQAFNLISGALGLNAFGKIMLSTAFMADDVGALSLNVSSVPEPGAGLLSMLGLAGLALVGRRVRRQVRHVG